MKTSKFEVIPDPRTNGEIHYHLIECGDLSRKVYTRKATSGRVYHYALVTLGINHPENKGRAGKIISMRTGPDFDKYKLADAAQGKYEIIKISW